MDVKKKVDCDVVIVGGGNAGMLAAIAAKNRGAKVLLIEKSPRKSRGGNSRFTDALFRIPSERGTKDYELLVKGGNVPKEEVDIEPYTKDHFYNDLMRLSGGLAEKRFAEIVVNGAIEAVTWMKEQGLKWDIWAGHMSKRGNRLFLPAGQLALQASGAGEGLVEMLYGIVEKKGGEVLYETIARKLVMNADGRICGVVAMGTDGLIQIDARSVILACGGFQANPAWRRRYLGENWDLVKLRGTRYNTGDGIQMAEEVGAHFIGHWGGCHASVVSEDSPMVEAGAAASMRYSYPFSIMVNRNGERFADEGENFVFYTYAKFGKETLKQPGSIAFQIFDSKVIPILTADYKDAVRVESQSLKELAEEFDINVEPFLKTVKEYNDAVVPDERPLTPFERDGRRTKGLKIDKTNWALKIDSPPYRGYAVVCGLTMSYGGLKTNDQGQVLDTGDRPIKGLYAVGEITGGLFFHNYPGGAGLTKGAVLGKIAGETAAKI
ncbi:MAG: FAD-dependent tricarballylate dehydrogenase TcuA [Thermodesulfobacteriota bacterium]|nr:FAD-dependent tricarballylate dehydrogenase TcuA [Thermodesulfobacteriota bacterium]